MGSGYGAQTSTNQDVLPAVDDTAWSAKARERSAAVHLTAPVVASSEKSADSGVPVLKHMVRPKRFELLTPEIRSLILSNSLKIPGVSLRDKGPVVTGFSVPKLLPGNSGECRFGAAPVLPPTSQQRARS